MIGILGGSFDPPHLGHQMLAEESRAALKLESILWMVTADPPHKPETPLTPIEHRVGMVEASITDQPEDVLSRLEIDRPGPHYAAETLARLAADHPRRQQAYLMGEDSLRDLPTWHTPQRFVELCDVIVALSRPNVDTNLTKLELELPGLSAKLHLIETPMIDVSSSDIRMRVREIRPYRHLVAATVADYIEQHGLYR